MRGLVLPPPTSASSSGNSGGNEYAFHSWSLNAAVVALWPRMTSALSKYTTPSEFMPSSSGLLPTKKSSVKAAKPSNSGHAHAGNLTVLAAFLEPDKSALREVTSGTAALKQMRWPLAP